MDIGQQHEIKGILRLGIPYRWGTQDIGDRCFREIMHLEGRIRIRAGRSFIENFYNDELHRALRISRRNT